ncbi:MAG: biotin/lipoyl-binding protein [Oscillospiraceae bacterium]|nr:biotin/lipoyl-binding protein [Oscillospiraceae bacterium]
MKKWIVLCLALAMVLTLAACGEAENAVYVQSVADLANMGGIAPGDRFPGIVVSENTTEIQKDSQMVVEELLVREGDDVTEGQKLFSYDSQQLQLALDKQRLELEQMEATIQNYKDQIKELEKDRNNASGNKLEYTVQIQSLQVDLKEAEINIKAKQSAVAQSELLLENTVVYSPVTGRIQSISENGMDNYGNPLPYITIQKAGSYRVKGTIGELQRGAIMEGTRLQILSRTDGSCWAGTVTLIDYENPSQGTGNEMYYGMPSDEMSSSSKYPFYVELDATDGLILGQHVYLQLENQEESAAAGPSVSSAFIAYDDDGSTYVWADKNGKLEKRTVTLGEYNFMNDTYEILSGLTEEDFIAFPDIELCVEGAPTTKVQPAKEDAAQDAVVGMAPESVVAG